MRMDDWATVRGEPLVRNRLLQKLMRETGAGGKLFYLTAPAGYGKTVLLAQFVAERGNGCLWLVPEQLSSNDWGVLEQLKPKCTVLETTGPKLLSYLSTISLLGTADKPNFSYVVVDGFSAASLAPESLASVVALLQQLGITCFVSSRADESKCLRSAVHSAQVTVLTPDDLCLTFDEARAIVWQYNSAAPEYIVDLLHSRTAGWPALLQTVLDAIPSNDLINRAKVDSHLQRLIRHFLTEQLPTMVPSDLAKFAATTVPLGDLTESLCAQVLGENDSAAKLDALVRAYILIPVKLPFQTVYRHNRLFAEYWLEQEEQQRPMDLLLRAARYHLGEGRVWQGLSLALLSGDVEQLVALLRQHWVTVLRDERWNTLMENYSLVKGQMQHDPDPWLQLIAGCALGLSRKSPLRSEGDQLVRQAYECFSRENERHGQRQCILYQAARLRLGHDASAAIQLLEEALNERVGLSINEWYDLVLELAKYLVFINSFQTARAHLEAALQQARIEQDWTAQLYLSKALINVCYRLGEEESAVAIFAELMNRGLALDVYSALRDSDIALAYHNVGDLQQALEIARTMVGMYESDGMLEYCARAHCHLATIYQSLGDLPSAFYTYETAAHYARRMKEDVYLGVALTGQGRVKAAMGELLVAQRLVQEGLRVTSANSTGFFYALCLLDHAVVSLQSGDLGPSLEMLSTAAEKFAVGGARRLEDVARVLLAAAYLRQGDRRMAQRCLQRCHYPGTLHDAILLPYKGQLDQLKLQFVAQRVDSHLGAGLQEAKQTTEGSTGVCIQCFGALQVSLQERPQSRLVWRTSKARDVFAYLVHLGIPVNKGKLIDALWPEVAWDKAEMRLHNSLYNLRRAFKAVGVESIVERQGTYFRLAVDVSSDVIAYKELVRAGNADKNPLPLLERAVALYKGPYLEELDYEWAEQERRALELDYLALLRRLAEGLLETGEPGRALSYLRRYLSIDAFAEGIYRLVMLAYDRMGNKQAVSLEYEALCQLLQSEMGVTPEAETVFLYKSLLKEATPRPV